MAWKAIAFERERTAQDHRLTRSREGTGKIAIAQEPRRSIGEGYPKPKSPSIKRDRRQQLNHEGREGMRGILLFLPSDWQQRQAAKRLRSVMHVTAIRGPGSALLGHITEAEYGRAFSLFGSSLFRVGVIEA